MSANLEITGDSVTLPPNNFFFQFENKNLITITSKGELIFHRENFPEYTADEFAEKFIRVIEAYRFTTFKAYTDNIHALLRDRMIDTGV